MTNDWKICRCRKCTTKDNPDGRELVAYTYKRHQLDQTLWMKKNENGARLQESTAAPSSSVLEDVLPPEHGALGELGQHRSSSSS